MASKPYAFDAELWLWEGTSAAWHFVSVPEDDADDIEARYGHKAKGFGSVPVQATIGTTRWKTSIFPDSKRGTYLLPVKRAVRDAEGLAEGDVAHVELTIVG
jgi:hypothetical protein